LGLVFLDVNAGLIDTIRIVIPNPPLIIEEVKPVAEAKASSPEKRVFLEMPDTSTENRKEETVVSERRDLQKPKGKCAAMATDDDFFKLRRDIASKKTEQDMIAQARKHFRNRCFKTEQIKFVSALFLTDEGKYSFFDTAYMHVSDLQNFESLQSEISEAYYRNRFKALIGK
jgi:hypothetical protein